MSGLFGGGKQINNSEQKIGSLRVQSSSQGLPVALVYGQTRVSVNMIWYGDFTPVPHTESTRSGKGGGPTINNTSYSYTAATILALCEGPIGGVDRVWSNKDITTTANLGLTLFEGTTPQTAWSYMTTAHANEALGYQGTAYVASAALSLGNSASMPNLSMEVEGFLFDSACEPDANPADIISDILTAPAYGAGFPSAMVGDLTDFSDYCNAAGLLASPAYTTQQSAAEIITELADIGNSGIVWSGGLLKVIPYAEESVTRTPSVANVTAATCGTGSSEVACIWQLGPDVYGWPNIWLASGNSATISGTNFIVVDSNVIHGNNDLSADFGVNHGCRYFEIYVVAEGGASSVEFARAGLVRSNSFGAIIDRGQNWSIGSDTSASFATGKTIRVAFEASTGYAWIGEGNGPWVGLGDPALGTSPSFTGITGTVAPWLTYGADYASGNYTIRTTTAEFAYSPPAGFSAWGARVWTDSEESVVCEAGNTPVTFTPSLTVQYDLTYDDFIADPGADPIKVTRKRQADAKNQVKVECLNRDDAYNTAVVDATDQWNVDLYGLRPADTISCHAIADPAVARAMASIKLQRLLYQRNTYAFTLGWRYSRLEPMDIVSLTDVKLGLSLTPVRITAVEEDGESGVLNITAEELLIGVSAAAGTAANFAVQAAASYAPNGAVAPGDTNPPVIFQPPAAVGTTPQIWIGASGGPEWGGAQIWASTDDSSYEQVGTLTAPAAYGLLTANFAHALDPDTTSTLSVDLSASNGSIVSAGQAAANALSTLAYVGQAGVQVSNELIATSAANLTSPYNYDLDTYIRRGQSGTVSSAHAANQVFMVCNEAVARVDIPESVYGTTIYIKLLAFNRTGGGLQSLADVPPYAFTVTTPAGTVAAGSTGYQFLADTSNTTANVASGHIRWNNTNPASANLSQLFVSQTTADGANISSYLASLGNTGLIELRDAVFSTGWYTYRFTAASANGSHVTFNATVQANGTSTPANNAPLLASFTPTSQTSVGLTMPAIFSVANSPVTTTGTLTVSLVSQNAGLVWAGPTSGNAAAPTFRSLVAGDFPAGIAAGAANQNASQVFAGPVSGAANTPAFRSLVGGDMPKLTINTQTANYTLALADANIAYIRMNSANATVVTVPPNANVNFANGSNVLVNRAGAGNVTISAGANVTVNNSSSNTLRAQKSTVALVYVGADVWDLFGDTT